MQRDLQGIAAQWRSRFPMKSFSTTARAPMFLSAAAVAFSWQELARRVGLPDESGSSAFEEGGVSVQYGVTPGWDGAGLRVRVRRASPDAWWRLIEAAPESLAWRQAAEVLPRESAAILGGPVPVLFWGEGCDQDRSPFVELAADGLLTFNADIVAATFFMLSRWEETLKSPRDQWGRFPATASVAFRQGFLDRPLVDIYAQILREWLRNLVPGLRLRASSFEVRLSHDIDAIRKYSNWRKILYHTLSESFGGIGLSAVGQAIQGTFFPRKDPYLRGILRLLEVSRANRLRSTFYLMTADSAVGARQYWTSERSVKEILGWLSDAHHEIGLHPCMGTLDDLDLLIEERRRLQAVVGPIPLGARQHYLAFRVPETWRNLAAAGLHYDATLGYADQEGFRCGTCHRYRPFDVEKDRVLDIWEEPLIVMDGTLKRYRRLSPSAARDRIISLAGRCQLVGGVFTLLWHNSSLDGTWGPWGAMYPHVVEALASMQSMAGGPPGVAQ